MRRIQNSMFTWRFLVYQGNREMNFGYPTIFLLKVTLVLLFYFDADPFFPTSGLFHRRRWGWSGGGGRRQARGHSKALFYEEISASRHLARGRSDGVFAFQDLDHRHGESVRSDQRDQLPPMPAEDEGYEDLLQGARLLRRQRTILRSLS